MSGDHDEVYLDLDTGVWMAYNVGESHGPGVPFATEVEALRHALRNHMEVGFFPWGSETPEQGSASPAVSS